MHFGVYAPSSPFGRSRNHQSENEQIYQTGTGPAITDKQVYVCLCYLKSLVRYIFIFGTVKLFHIDGGCELLFESRIQGEDASSRVLQLWRP